MEDNLIHYNQLVSLFYMAIEQSECLVKKVQYIIIQGTPNHRLSIYHHLQVQSWQ